MNFVLFIVGLLTLYFAAKAWVFGVRLSLPQFTELIGRIEAHLEKENELKIKSDGFLVGYSKKFSKETGIKGHAYLPSSKTLWLFYESGKRAHFKGKTVADMREVLRLFLTLAAYSVDINKVSDKSGV